MTELSSALIYLGSALMLLNIVRYILLEPEITACPFAVSIVAKIPIPIVNGNRSVRVAIYSKLCFPLGAERATISVTIMMINILLALELMFHIIMRQSIINLQKAMGLISL